MKHRFDHCDCQLCKRRRRAELKPVTVDLKTTALLILDFIIKNCGKRPRCLDTIPAMKKLLAEARVHKGTSGLFHHRQQHARDVMNDVAPRAG